MYQTTVGCGKALADVQPDFAPEWAGGMGSKGMLRAAALEQLGQLRDDSCVHASREDVRVGGGSKAVTVRCLDLLGR